MQLFTKEPTIFSKPVTNFLYIAVLAISTVLISSNNVTAAQASVAVIKVEIKEAQENKTLLQQKILNLLTEHETYLRNIYQEVKKETVTTENIAELKNSLLVSLNSAWTELGYTYTEGMTVKNPFLKQPHFNKISETMTWIKDKQKNLDIAFQNWNTSVQQEKDRIAAEEAAKAAAEAEAFQQKPYVKHETPEERLSRLAAAAGLTAAVYYDDQTCGTISSREGYTADYNVACFHVSTQTITVTPYGYTQNDSYLQCALIHESRHLWQYQNGLIEYNPDGTIANRDWLEADAYAYASGC